MMKNLNQYSSLLAIGFAGLAQLGCDDGGGGSSPGGKGGTAGSAGASGSSGSSFGGSGAVGGAAGSSFGGTSSGAGGSVGGSAGSGAGGSSGIELVNREGWVGGDPASSTDNPLGLQGAWYAYGDDGKSCTIPDDFNPCTSGKCCLEGATLVDSTFAAWGCGIGLELNSSGDTDAGPSVKRAFAGTAKTFTATISGNSGGNPIRINFTQEADTSGKVSPYREVAPVTATVTETAGFADAVYPTWCDTNAGCMGKQGQAAVATSSYDIQFQIPGGTLAGAFSFCIDSLKVSP
jgi:hypothetical protein